MEVNYKSPNCILKCSFAVLIRVLKYKVNQNFVKVWKFFTTAGFHTVLWSKKQLDLRMSFDEQKTRSNYIIC